MTQEQDEEELLTQIKQVNKWEWYITQKPKWLAERLKARFDTEVTSRKLRAVGRELKKEGELEGWG